MCQPHPLSVTSIDDLAQLLDVVEVGIVGDGHMGHHALVDVLTGSIEKACAVAGNAVVVAVGGSHILNAARASARGLTDEQHTLVLEQ